MTKAIVSLSGGQDSATCLSWARSKFDEVYSISFHYGQKHQTEIECAEKLSKLANVKEHFIVRIDQLFDEINISNNAMVRSDKDVNENHHLLTHLPSTFVPFRNLFLLSAAAAKGLDYRINNIVTGICQIDYCIPENEFVNTNYGKIPISDVKCGDKVLSSDKNGNLSFKKVINKFNNGLRTDILGIETEAGRKIRVTSNHKIFKVERSNYSHKKGWDKKIVKVRADCLKTGDYILNPSPIKDIYNECDFSKTISNEIINKYENVDLLGYCDLDNPRLRYNDHYIWFRRDNLVNRYVNKNDLVKLIAWYTAEGNRGSGSTKNANSYRIGISQSRKNNAINYREIVQTAKKFGYNVTENKEMIYFSGPTTKIFEMCGELSDNRWIPTDFIYINMPLLFETLIEADGSISSNGSNDYYSYSTKSWTLKEQICWMGTIFGFSTGVHYNFEKLYNVNMVKNHKKKMNRIGDLKMCKIKEIKEINEQPINVCDINVEDNHSFITGLGSGILVSNSGYPDCREIFRYHLEDALSASVEMPINVKAPLMFKTKAEIVELMKELGTLHWYEHTHTCYEGMRPACGKCPACKLRLRGFQEAGINDPIEYLKKD